MARLDYNDVEHFLDMNPDLAQDYFYRKIDVSWINKWLTGHGYHALHDYISGRRDSYSQESSGPTSPSPELRAQDTFFVDKDGCNIRHQRSNSKKHLRHDFARSRMRSMFRTCESASSEATVESRRSSLKGMRQFLSLPPTSVNMLSMLIQSKVRLPRYTSKDEQIKRELHSSNDKEFFLEIVKEISNDLDLKALSTKILINIAILVDADRCSLFLVEGSQGKKVLVSKVFDVYSGTNILPTVTGGNIVKIPWGKGIIGHVAETGCTVNITNASEVRNLFFLFLLQVSIL